MKTVIFGDSAFAERILFFIKAETNDEVVAFTTTSKTLVRNQIEGIPVIPLDKLDESIGGRDFSILLAIGYSRMNQLRESIYKDLLARGYTIRSFVSKNSILYSNRIGEGCIILPNSYIGPNVVLGVCNFVAASCSISHDTVIGDFNFFSTGVIIGGFANVGNHCFIGLNSTVKSEIFISDYTLVGSSTNMLCPTEENCVYVGNPGKRLENKKALEVTI